MHLPCCASEPYDGLIETFFVHITAYPILKSPAQDFFKKIWLSRENIKVTLIKGQDHEAPESPCEKKLRMLVLLGEPCSRNRTANQGLRKERTASSNTSFAHPGAWEKPRAVPAVHTSSSELHRCLTSLTILLRNCERCFDFIDEKTEGY